MLYSLNNGGNKLWYHVLIKHEKGGRFTARCVSKGLTGAISDGETLEETFGNISEAIELIEEVKTT